MAEMTIKKRPKNLDLTTIQAAAAGKVSILHRVSGADCSSVAPILLWLFGASGSSPETFATVNGFASLPVKVVLAGLIWAYLHHFCAGIRFPAADCMSVSRRKRRTSLLPRFSPIVSIPLTLVLWGFW